MSVPRKALVSFLFLSFISAGAMASASNGSGAGLRWVAGINISDDFHNAAALEVYARNHGPRQGYNASIGFEKNDTWSLRIGYREFGDAVCTNYSYFSYESVRRQVNAGYLAADISRPVSARLRMSGTLGFLRWHDNTHYGSGFSESSSGSGVMVGLKGLWQWRQNILLTVGLTDYQLLRDQSADLNYISPEIGLEYRL